MAKNYIFIGFILLFNGFGSGCIYKNDLNDTDPASPVAGTVTKVDPAPIQDVYQVDTVQKVTTITEAKDPKKPDTIKQVVVVNYGPIDHRAMVQAAYISQIGVRELTGRNDGPAVEMYLRSTGLGKGNPWCSAFVYWCLTRGGVKSNITAWSPTSFNAKNPVWYKGKFVKAPQRGDVFSLWYGTLGRIGHTGFWDRSVNSSIFETVEGNTNEQGSREGGQVLRRKRGYNSVYAISTPQGLK